MPPQILYRLFVKENYDVEIAFFRGASIKILSGSTNKKSKKLAWVHSDFTRCTGIFDWFISEKQTINAYKQFDKIICVSEYAKNKFIERMGINKNVIVRYNVNLCNEIIEKSNEKIDEIKNSIKFTICTVGHLGEAKGYDRLLEVHKMLIDEKLYHNLVIVGSGTSEEEKVLVDYINENKLNKTVYLMGQQENPYKYIANADLFVCSSRWEGFSTVISEATILKTPIVTTRVSGVDELFLDNEYGLITENNTESLYEGLKSILIDKDLYNYYKDKIIERSQFFNTELAVKSIEQLF